MSPSINPELDYVFTYPVTVFTAVKKDMSDESDNLALVIEKLEQELAKRQLMIPDGSPDTAMMWGDKEGMIGKLPVRKTFEPIPDNRKDHLITERAIGAYVDTRVPIIIFNRHVSDIDEDNDFPHVTPEERFTWNHMTPLKYFTDHLSDTNDHLAYGERDRWNDSISTEEFNLHLEDTRNPHRVTASQTGAYTRQQVDQIIEDHRPKFFIYKNISWDMTIEPNVFDLILFRPENFDPNLIFDYRYNPEYQVDPVAKLPNGDTVMVSDPHPLPKLDYGKRYFALVAKLPPMVDSRGGEVIICYKGETDPDLVPVETVYVDNGDLFITYPSSWIYLWSGGRFLRLSTDFELN